MAESPTHVQNERTVRIPLSDGHFLAATLYLPDPVGGPQPCLIEALPYRKDDLTSSYADSYQRFRDEFGYAVCRIDVRGTGSSSGDPIDEYQEAEQRDLAEAIEWLAAREWCDGNIGMWGTSYSGFNSLQLACEQPPALKAVIGIYSSDDRWTDDVHWRGGALRLVDLVDYCHYMTPMPMLPPVPRIWGEGWREEWLRRLETTEPWVLTWLRENRDGPYWRHGSVRLPHSTGDGYDRITCPVMLVAGWADGYRNNSFRTVEALGRHGVPFRLLAGPWVHADPTTAYPGPRIDLDYEMAAWWDRWLRPARNSVEDKVDVADIFVRTATRPAAFLDQHEGYWVRDHWPSENTTWNTRELPGERSLDVRPDTGVAAWIDCAGHLPWGLSTDQRDDDARSLVWDWPATGEIVIGQPKLRLQVSADQSLASVSVKLNDVFPDGASALVSRGTLDLRFRDGVHAPNQPSPLTPGEIYDVDLELDACAYQFLAGQRLRIAIAGSDWPNTIAPPHPVTLTVHEAELALPLWTGPGLPVPEFTAGAAHANEEPQGVHWDVTRDVLRDTTTCTVSYGGDPYDIPGGQAHEQYAGRVFVDNVTFAQHAYADCTFTLTWPDEPGGPVSVEVGSTMQVEVTEAGYDVDIAVTAYEGDTLVTTRTWTEHIPR